MESVLLDLDDTFFDASQVLADAIEAEHGVKSDPATWTTYKFTDIYPLPPDSITDAWIKHDVFSKMDLLPGALDIYVYCRDRGIHVEFVTARGFDPDAHDRTVDRLSKVLGASPEHGNYSVTIIKWGENKHEQFKSLDPILYVDDSQNSVLDMQLNHGDRINCFVMAHPHNRGHFVGGIAYVDGYALRTVKSMYDALDILQHLRGQRLASAPV